MKGTTSWVLTAVSCVLLTTPGCGDSDSGKPTCAADALVAPEIDYPAFWETVDSLIPTLEWSYPDKSCNPQQYDISLSQGPLFDGFTLTTISGNDTSWSPDPLEPGLEHLWCVAATTNGTRGEFACNQFFTGPACDANSLTAPTLLSPADGADVNIEANGGVSLVWEYPEPCLPDHYRIELSSNPDFVEPSIFDSRVPSTQYGTNVLPSCTRYYWRVAARVGDSEEYSDVHRFRTVDATGCTPEP